MFGGRSKAPPAQGGGLVVGPRDRVHGTVTAQLVTVAGRLDGHVESATTLAVTSSGHLSGTIASKRLTIEPGAVVRAACRIGLPPLEAEPSPAPGGTARTSEPQTAPMSAAESRRVSGRGAGKADGGAGGG